MGFGSIVGSALGAVGSLAGGLIANQSQNQLAQQNYAAQKEFAQNGIRWKVADAKAAGLHPLAALGAQGYTYNPVMVGGSDLGLSAAGESLAQMGQGIDRAMSAKQQAAERQAYQAYEAQVRQKDLALKDKQLALLDSEIAQNMANSRLALSRAQLPPAMPPSSPRTALPGQGDLRPANQNLDKTINKYGFVRNEEGKLELIPGEDYASRTEDKAVIEWLPWLETAGKTLQSALFGKRVGGREYYVGYGWLTPQEFKRIRSRSARAYRPR